jgi:hypothetical protein
LYSKYWKEEELKVNRIKVKINTEYLIIGFLVLGAEIKKGGVSPPPK